MRTSNADTLNKRHKQTCKVASYLLIALSLVIFANNITDDSFGLSQYASYGMVLYGLVYMVSIWIRSSIYTQKYNKHRFKKQIDNRYASAAQLIIIIAICFGAFALFFGDIPPNVVDKFKVCGDNNLGECYGAGQYRTMKIIDMRCDLGECDVALLLDDNSIMQIRKHPSAVVFLPDQTVCVKHYISRALIVRGKSIKSGECDPTLLSHGDLQ